MGGGSSRGPSVGFVDNEPPLFVDPEEPAEADSFVEPALSRSGTGRSGSGRSGSAPPAARPMVRRRSLVSSIVKAKRANVEAEIEGLTEEQLFKAGKSFASYLLFLVVFSVTAAVSPASRLPPPKRAPDVRARCAVGCARAHAASSAPRQVVVFSPHSSHDFWANTAMKQLLVERRFHFGTDPNPNPYPNPNPNPNPDPNPHPHPHPHPHPNPNPNPSPTPYPNQVGTSAGSFAADACCSAYIAARVAGGGDLQLTLTLPLILTSTLTLTLALTRWGSQPRPGQVSVFSGAAT